MAKLIVKNGYQEDMCQHEIGLCAKSVDIILGSIIDRVRKAYGGKKERIFTLTSYITCASEPHF